MTILDIFGKQDGNYVKFDMKGNCIRLEEYTTISVSAVWIEWKFPEPNSPYALETSMIPFGNDGVRQLLFGCTDKKAITSMVRPATIQKQSIKMEDFENVTFQILCPFQRKILPVKRIYLQLKLH